MSTYRSHRRFPQPLRAAPLARLQFRPLALVALLVTAAVALAGGQALATTTIIDDFTVVADPSPWDAHPGSVDLDPAEDVFKGMNLRNFLVGNTLPPIPNNLDPSHPSFVGRFVESGLANTALLPPNSPGVFGGMRTTELAVKVNDPGDQNIAMVDVLPAGPQFNFETGIGTAAEASLFYSGQLPAGAPSGNVVVTIIHWDNFNHLDHVLAITLKIDDGSNPAGQMTFDFSTPLDPFADSPIDVTFALNDAAFSGIDFSVPVDLAFTFAPTMVSEAGRSPALERDFGISAIFLETTPNGVPEPSTLALAGIGLAGFVGLAWRRRRRGTPRHAAIGAVALLGIVVLGSPGWAVTIDSFDVGGMGTPPFGMFVTAPAGSSDSDSEVGLSTSHVIGGQRDSEVFFESGPSDVFVFMRITSDGHLVMTTESGAEGRWTLDYPSFPAVDLTEGGTQDGIGVHFLVADFSATVKVTLDTTLGTLHQELMTAGPGLLKFEFSDFLDGFSTITPVDSSVGVTGIHFEIDGSLNGDYTIELIETYSGAHAPEPSTLALAGVGLVGVGAIGWRRRRAFRSRREAQGMAA